MLDKSIIFCLLAVSFGQIHNFGRCPTPSRGRVDLDRVYILSFHEIEETHKIFSYIVKYI